MGCDWVLVVSLLVSGWILVGLWLASDCDWFPVGFSFLVSGWVLVVGFWLTSGCEWFLVGA